MTDIFKEDVGWLEDMPTGSDLDKYRESASFHWKHLRIVLEDPDILKMKMHVWKNMENDPEFHPIDTSVTPSSDEHKRITARQSAKLDHRPYTGDVDGLESLIEKMKIYLPLGEAITMMNPSFGLKQGIGMMAIAGSILWLGTERHKSIAHAVWNKKMLGCFALSEVGHGSNAAQLRTTATFDPSSQCFVIHTPDFQAAKCWIGNLGKTATISIVFAQLITKNVTRGLHAFIVPIRDPKTYLPYPGLVIGDVGDKVGHNNFDLGYMEFNHYKIAKENLLSKMADVTSDGEYKSSFSDSRKQLAAVFKNLSIPRVAICAWSANRMGAATAIATRYAAVRKQFSSSKEKADEETPIIEYELHQWRIFPYLAASCVTRIFMSEFLSLYLSYTKKSVGKEEIPNINEITSELHCMISAIKPLLTWTCQDAIKECRAACGGHGYLKKSGFGSMANDHEATVTYEGDNNVLSQQTSKWILQQWNNVQSNRNSVSPLGSVKFFTRSDDVLKRKFEESEKLSLSLEFVRDSYEWLITWLLIETRKCIAKEMSRGASLLEANNKSQVYKASILTKAYGEMIILHYCTVRLQKLVPSKCESESHGLKKVLDKLVLLYSLTSLEKYLPIFYQGGYCVGPKMAASMKDKILRLCSELKPEAVSVADALAPPDFILNSILGMSDGKVYERLESALKSNPGSLERAKWWYELLDKTDKPSSIPSWRTELN